MHSRKKDGTIGPLLGKLGQLGTGDNGKGKIPILHPPASTKEQFSKQKYTQKMIEVKQKVRRNYFKWIKNALNY